MNTYNKKIGRSDLRLVVKRPGDEKSFFEATQYTEGEKRVKHNYVLMDMSESDLKELRDFLNRVV